MIDFEIVSTIYMHQLNKKLGALKSSIKKVEQGMAEDTFIFFKKKEASLDTDTKNSLLYVSNQRQRISKRNVSFYH